VLLGVFLFPFSAPLPSAFGSEAAAPAAPAAPAVAPAKAAAAKTPPAPPPPKTAAIIDLPPVSDEALNSLLDYLAAHLIHEADCRATQDRSQVPPPERELDRLAVYINYRCEGLIIVGLMSAGEGRMLVLKTTSTEKEMIEKFGEILKAAQGRVQMLNASAMKDILTRAKMSAVDLSYIKTDKALGMLKAMGYNVVEMTEAAGVSASKTYTLSSVTDFRLPLVTCFIDADSTSLAETKGKQPGGPLGQTVTPDIGGASLTSVTDTSAQQRLLVCYDAKDPDSLRRLIDDVQTIIDVPAQQILIEGMILEVNADKLRELGADYRASDTQSITYWEDHTRTGAKPETPFTVDMGAWSVNNEGFMLRLRALVDKGAADILSKPSVMALNNYQARIRIGREIPISTTVATAATTNLNVSYFFMGIVLNIKPRVGHDQKEVSMQVETIVSSKAPVKALTTVVAGNEVEVAPVVDSRVVQTFARVSNNTPFIIGGLISHDIRDTRTGIPLLMDVPLLSVLFGKTTKKETRNEVIVVLTPRIVPLESDNYFAVIPKDSDKFDTGTSLLFRNSYRSRGQDIFDLTFVREEPRYVRLAERAADAAREKPELARDSSVQSILGGRIPGETPIMIRMLYEIVKSRRSAEQISTQNIIMFEPRREEVGAGRVFELPAQAEEVGAGRVFELPAQAGEVGAGRVFELPAQATEQIKVKYLANELKALGEPGQTTKSLVLQFDLAGRNDHSRFMPPLTIQALQGNRKQDYENWMRMHNKMNDDGTFDTAAIVIRGASDLDRLKTCLVLKKLLEINNLPTVLHVKDFPVGMQVLYPNLEDQEDRKHVVDAKVAELFYFSDYYYQAFQQIYKAELAKIEEKLAE